MGQMGCLSHAVVFDFGAECRSRDDVIVIRGRHRAVCQKPVTCCRCALRLSERWLHVGQRLADALGPMLMTCRKGPWMLTVITAKTVESLERDPGLYVIDTTPNNKKYAYLDLSAHREPAGTCVEFEALQSPLPSPRQV